MVGLLARGGPFRARTLAVSHRSQPVPRANAAHRAGSSHLSVGQRGAGESNAANEVTSRARSSTAERDEGASVGAAERELVKVREREPHGVTPAMQRGQPSGE